MKKRLAIIIASDKGAAGTREDQSGPAIAGYMENLGYTLVATDILPDERAVLAARLAEIADGGQAELILTSGGTGFSPRDCTPEATADVCERMAPGLGEAMRAYSMQFTGRAMLSRATAGIRGTNLIINLPGSPKAVVECLDCIAPQLDHGIEILTGAGGECAR